MPFILKLININTISALEVCIGMGSVFPTFPSKSRGNRNIIVQIRELLHNNGK